jgi:hypothetical protein
VPFLPFNPLVTLFQLHSLHWFFCFHALLNENMEFLYRERPFTHAPAGTMFKKSIVVRSPCTKDLGACTLSLPAIRSDSYLSCEPYRPPCCLQYSSPLPLSSGWRIAASNGEDTA